MLYTLFILQFLLKLCGNLLLLFSMGIIFAGIGYALISISKISVDMIYDICICMKQNLYGYKYLLYIILFIDIVYLILSEIQRSLLKNMELHI